MKLAYSLLMKNHCLNLLGPHSPRMCQDAFNHSTKNYHRLPLRQPQNSSYVRFCHTAVSYSYFVEIFSPGSELCSLIDVWGLGVGGDPVSPALGVVNAAQ